MQKLGKPRTSKGLALFCAKIADSKIAKNILILDLTDIENAPAEQFVVCSCDSSVQVRAVADEVIKKGKELKMASPKIEGAGSCYWVIIDFFDVVMHIMQKSARDYYKLERLWSDAKFLFIDNAGQPKAFSRKDISSIYSDV
jgi:ribosome-associated protein